jgi:LacI family transcriptional regulator
VPHQVAVLGGDDDKLLSQASLPALSGIVVPARSIGRRAAEILEELMSGKGISNKFITIESSRINARASSDTYALSDCATLQALHYLRENFMRPISINDLLEAVPMARRTLEIKFNRYLGRSPADELRALRIAHAQKLLVETELSLQEVAEKCGLSSYNYLSHFFKKSTGETPAHYRKMARLSR